METVRFSPSGEYVAVSGNDGRLKIYESATNKFLQEFVSSSHLTEVCNCLEWAPNSRKAQQMGRKKKKKLVEVEGDIVVMGTSLGSIFVYDVARGELTVKSQEEHHGKVTGLSWSHLTLLLYSCGEDGFILEWDPVKCTVSSRWKGSKHGLTAIRVFQENLLAAGQKITLWDLRTKTIMKTFTGHPSFINQLETVSPLNSATGDYFISMGDNERHLKIWSSTEQNAVANLTVPETPNYFHVSVLVDTSEVMVSVTTKSGILYIFKHKLNGPVKKALVPSYSIKILDSSDNTVTVPIITCFLSDTSSDQSNLTCVYGDWMRFHFEKFDSCSLEPQTIITRQFSLPSKSNLSKKLRQQQASENVQVPNNVKHLQPGVEPLQSSIDQSKKRKKGIDGAEVNAANDGELPMEERLTNLTMENPVPVGMKGNNLAHLLSQGLHSKDSRILQSVLSRWDEDVVMNTVRSLPVQLIVPLLNEIKVIQSGKGQLNNSNLCWLKSVLKIHSSYLMNCPNADELLTPFMSLLHTRQVLYPQMCQLRGKLELLKGHIEAKQYSSEPPNDALLVFHDDSPDEDALDDAMLLSESEEGFLTSDDLGVEDSEDDVDAGGKSNTSSDDSDLENEASDEEVAEGKEEEDEDSDMEEDD